MSKGSKGKVYLVGAGPGHPKLITVRGLEVLRRSDAVVYDRLAGPDLLREIRPDAERYYVGKLPDRHTMKQEAINALLVELALAGKTVTRLKGGDPSVFGRVGEEAEALVRNGVPYEIVPGITSAVAVPAYAGIPVTHRGYASSFAVVTGHESPEKLETQINWPKLATATDTLVFLMGMAKVDYISRQLMANGRPGDTPAAVIRWGTRAEQTSLTGTLATIAEQVRERDLQPPAVIVVGAVAGLSERLAWYEHLPLFGCRVMVTRARSQASQLADRLTELGGEVVECPLIRIQEPSDERERQRMDETLRNPDAFDWLVFTSVNGVDFFLNRLAALRRDIRSLAGVRLAAVGPKTAEAMEARGLYPDLQPEAYRGEELAKAFAGVIRPGQRVLLPRGDKASPLLPRRLSELGARITELAVYETVPDEEGARAAVEMLKQGEIQVVTFTSSSTVHNLWNELLRQGFADPLRLLSRPAIACIGPVTTGAARTLGLDVAYTAGEATIEALADGIAEFMAERRVRESGDESE